MEILLSNGHVALVDPVDYETVSKYKWRVDNNGYSVRYYRADGKLRVMYMHRQIMGIEEWPIVDRRRIDHVNHDVSDNRRGNLRFATRSQNNGNSLLSKSNKSGFKGVSWNKHASKWRACIGVNGKVALLGYFSDKIEAAFAYNRAAIDYWGEFALINDLSEAKPSGDS